LRALSVFYPMTKEAVLEALGLLEQAIAIEETPNFPVPYRYPAALLRPYGAARRGAGCRDAAARDYP
jgi:hypothetical protein